jgi:hypothetical protein
MKIAFNFWGLFFVLFAFQSAMAQEIRSGSISLTVGPSFSIAAFDQPVTALMIETDNQNNFDHLRYFYQGSWHHLAHGHNEEHPFRSDPIVLADDVLSLQLTSQIQQNIILHTVYCPPYSTNIKLLKRNNAPCVKPNTISPSQWRNGLADPKPGRLSTPIAHCIVHHAAGSNFNTDYYNVVRNIYLLHTQTNGWDDIGYNYLIAQDGTLFIGRDPQGVNSEDNIQGAHFCSKNAFTMGTCLLGNYSDTIPSDTTWAILKQLLVWKLIKDKLNPLDSSLHPDASGNMLPVVAGHRDGCNTECPGQKVYDKLPQFRIDLKNAIDLCNLSNIQSVEKYFTLFLNNGYLNINLNFEMNDDLIYGIINQQGTIVQTGLLKTNSVNVERLPLGLYYLTLISDATFLSKKFLLINTQ